MCRRRIFLTTVGLMSLASTVAAEVVVELVPDNPGPYAGGESLAVDVWLHSEFYVDVILVSVRFDFQESDPALSFGSEFVFDYSSIPDDIGGYEDVFTNPELPVPYTANLLGCFCPMYFIQLPAGSSLHIGSIEVYLPESVGTYRVDMLNADEPDEILGARISTGAVCETCPDGGVWRAYTGEITGGTFDFVIPPPIPTLSTWGITAMTGLLLIAGSVIGARRTKRRSRFLPAIYLASASMAFNTNASGDPAEIPIKLVAG